MLSPLQVLKKYWGYDQFRSLQSDVIDSVMAGNDTVALLHTGAGKSVCYQVPALCLPGKTLVISPLIALMQDQVDALNKKGINAKAVYSGLKYQKLDLILDNFMNGPLKILYVSPERLQTDIFIERFKKTKISLIAVDESHCISQWGHDFRPAYYEIKSLREWHPEVPIIAVTATATPKVVEDITEKLEMGNPQIHTSTFERENLSFTVMLSEDKMDKLNDFLAKMKGSGIIYMRSRKKVEQLAAYLNKDLAGNDIASYYHGGLNMKTRMRVQREWIENKMKIIVCTNAFGMGVDKPDVRFVVHCDIPPSLEEYYQEAGRAGRDGKPSHAVSIINFGDIVKLQQYHQSSFPSLQYLETVYNRLCSYLKVGYGSGAGESFDLSLEDFCNTYRYHIGKVFNCLNIMEKEGWLFLNQAMRKPSQIVFTSDKGRISLSSRNKDTKSKMILHFIRKYEGIFTDFVSIDEGKLANELNIPLPKLIQELKVMDKETILAYRPASEDPRITFLMDRPAPNSFAIDEVRYLAREANAAEKIKAVQEYMTSFDCRQQTILRYFGEEKEACGRCDICRGTKMKLYTEEEKFALLVHLRKIAKDGLVHCDTYLRLWPYNKQNKAFAILQQLHIEREIFFDKDNSIQTDPKSINA